MSLVLKTLQQEQVHNVRDPEPRAPPRRTASSMCEQQRQERSRRRTTMRARYLREYLPGARLVHERCPRVVLALAEHCMHRLKTELGVWALPIMILPALKAATFSETPVAL